MNWNWIGSSEFLIPVLIAIVIACGFFKKRKDLKKARKVLFEIRNLVIFAKRAMQDGRLSESEKDKIIDQVAAIVKIIA